LFENLEAIVYWPEMRKDASLWVARCPGCIAYKTPWRKKANLELRREPSRIPFLELMWDLVEMPESEEGLNWVVHAICCSTAYPAFRSTKTKEAAEVAYALFLIVLEFGVIPRKLRSDQGREVQNAVIAALAHYLGIHLKYGAAYNPEAQGAVERPHRDLWTCLGVFLRECGLAYKEWPLILPIAEYVARHKLHLASRVTPYAATHGFFGSSPLRTVLDGLDALPASAVNDGWVRDLTERSRTIQEILLNARDGEVRASRHRDAEKRRAAEYQVGDLVFVQRPRDSKLCARAEGPYEVVATTDSSIQVAWPTGRAAGEPVWRDPDGNSAWISHRHVVPYPLTRDAFEQHLFDEERGSDALPKVGDIVIFSRAEDDSLGVAEVAHVQDDIITISEYQDAKSGKRGRPAALAKRQWTPSGEAASQISRKDIFTFTRLRSDKKLDHETVQLLVQSGRVVR